VLLGGCNDFATVRDLAGLRFRVADLLGYARVAEDPKREGLPEPPRLPQRAAIYIAPDGTVHFGALFEDLVPVKDALGGPPPAAASASASASASDEER
jgi:hypothetical protein